MRGVANRNRKVWRESCLEGLIEVAMRCVWGAMDQWYILVEARSQYLGDKLARAREKCSRHTP